MIWNPSSAGVDELGRSSSTTSWACDWVLFMGSWKPETSKGFWGIKRCGLVWAKTMNYWCTEKAMTKQLLEFWEYSDYSVCFCCWHFIAFAIDKNSRCSNCYQWNSCFSSASFDRLRWTAASWSDGRKEVPRPDSPKRSPRSRCDV